MEVLKKDKEIVGLVNCIVCNSTLKVERSDLRIKYGGFTGIMQVPYIICPICNAELTISDEELYRFGLKRSY